MSETLRHMPCQEFVEQVSYYLEGTLSAEDHARLEEHLDACAKCQGYLEQLRVTLSLTGKLSEETLTQPIGDELLDAFTRWRDGDLPMASSLARRQPSESTCASTSGCATR